MGEIKEIQETVEEPKTRDLSDIVKKYLETCEEGFKQQQELMQVIVAIFLKIEKLEKGLKKVFE